MEPTSDASTIDETADVTVGHSRVRRSSGSDTRIRAACGTVVRCSEGASRLSGFVKRWLDEPGEALTDDGPERLFQLQPDACISAETLRCLVNELEHTATRVVAGRNDQATGARETSMHFATLPMVDFFALHRAARFLECEHLELHLALHLASRLCGKTPQQIRKVFSIAGDLSDQRQRDSPSESVLTPPTDPRPGTAAPGGALACGAPQLARSLSLELGDEGAIFDCLGAADVQTVITLKGVSLAWRERARIALTDVACSSWRASAAVRGEAGGRLELRMIELHQQQALARVDASVDIPRLQESFDDYGRRFLLLPTTLTNRKGLHKGYEGNITRLLKEWRESPDWREVAWHAKDNIACHLLSLSPVGEISCFHAELLGQQGTPYVLAGSSRSRRARYIPADYPMSPPTVHFITPICHPNIELVGGKVSLDILQRIRGVQLFKSGRQLSLCASYFQSQTSTRRMWSLSWLRSSGSTRACTSSKPGSSHASMLGRGSTEVDAARFKLFRTDKVSRLPWTSAVPAPTVLRPLSASNTALCFFSIRVC